MFLMRLDENCDSLWMQVYGGRGDDICNQVLLLNRNWFCLVGSTNGIQNRNSVYLALFTDLDGAYLTEFRTEPNIRRTDEANCAVEIDDKLILGGINRRLGTDSQALLVGVNWVLRQEWDRYDGIDSIYEDDVWKSMILSNDFNIALTGHFGNGSAAFWILYN